jgi:hypothetical protein
LNYTYVLWQIGEFLKVRANQPHSTRVYVAKGLAKEHESRL